MTLAMRRAPCMRMMNLHPTPRSNLSVATMVPSLRISSILSMAGHLFITATWPSGSIAFPQPSPKHSSAMALALSMS